jgi:aminopeptidase-like protein
VNELSLLWVLNLADGEHTLVDMAERSGLPYATVRDAARTLEEHDLLEILA